MNETLRQKQSRFALLVAALINQAHVMGYEVTLGEAYRSGEEAARLGFKNSLHRSRLAIDLCLFRDGIFLTDSRDYQPLGEWWEQQGGSWGGRFSDPDGNHFSLAYEGRK